MPSTASAPSLALRVAAKQELDRRECAAAAAVCMERHFTIEEPDGTVIPLDLWEFQRDVVAALQNGELLIVLKARRLGLSWIVLAFALWLAIFQQGIRILVLCKNEDDAIELLDRIRRMRDRVAASPGSQHLLSNLPAPPKLRDAVTTLDIGLSTIRALVGTERSARSETAGFVILDEFAFAPRKGGAGIWRAILPTIEGGGGLAVVSTGNGSAESAGDGAEFARQWVSAIAGTSGLRAMFFPWQARPDRDEAWKQRTMAQLGDPERFATEYPEKPDDAFLSPDADLVYDASHLAAAIKAGADLDALPPVDRPRGPLWLGIDWGVNTHAILARQTAGGGLYAFAEVTNTQGDLEAFTAELCNMIDELGEPVSFERFDAAEPIIHQSFRRQYRERMRHSPEWLAIPFNKFKGPAIKYVKLLLRRTYEGEQMRTLAISPVGCPVAVRQMAKLQWDKMDAGRVVKEDDHGADAILTLVAELAHAHFAQQPAG